MWRAHIFPCSFFTFSFSVFLHLHCFQGVTMQERVGEHDVKSEQRERRVQSGSGSQHSKT